MATVSRRTTDPGRMPRAGAVAWALAGALWIVGDTTSTMLLLDLGGHESNQFVRLFLARWGYLGLWINKGVAILPAAIGYVLWPSVGDVGPDPYRLVLPVGLAGVGAVLVGRNLWLALELVM